MKKYFTTVFLIIRTQHDNDILYAAIMAISSVFTSYEEFVEENIHLFFSMKGLGLLKDMMDNKNTPKNLLAALLKIVGSIANGNEIAVQVI